MWTRYPRSLVSPPRPRSLGFGSGGSWDFAPKGVDPIATIILPDGSEHQVYEAAPAKERIGACLVPG